MRGNSSEETPFEFMKVNGVCGKQLGNFCISRTRANIICVGMTQSYHLNFVLYGTNCEKIN